MVDWSVWISSQVLFAIRMVKVLADPFRIKILEVLNMKDMSPKQFFEEYGGGSLTRVWRHFRVLEKYDWIEKVDTKTGGKRRGATENFYRAKRPAVLFNEEWAHLPKSAKETLSVAILETAVGYMRRAMEAGTFDARDDRHFSNTPLLLDQLGWERVVGRGDAFFEFLFEEQAEARVRLASSDEEPIPVTVEIAVFESPEPSDIAPWIDSD